MGTATKLVTYEEWLNMPEVSDAIEEVVKGEIRIMPPPKTPHADTVENLADMIRPQIDRKQVMIRTSQFGLVISREPLTTRVPDLALFIRKNTVQVDGYIHSAPELVVEVLSPANRRAEREEKLADYESIGVPEVWVLSPEACTVEVLQLEDGKLRRTALLRDGQIRPKLFPEVAVDIDAVWPK